MYSIEPIIIIYEDKHWNHPEIKEIVDHFKDDNQINETVKVWSGPWVRIYLEQDDKKIYTVCVFHEREKYEEHLKYCYKKFNEDTYDEIRSNEIIDDISGFLMVSLIEDVWMPGNEQFCFTEFGEQIGKYFDFTKEIKLSLLSPDVGLHNEGNIWVYST